MEMYSSSTATSTFFDYALAGYNGVMDNFEIVYLLIGIAIGGLALAFIVKMILKSIKKIL